MMNINDMNYQALYEQLLVENKELKEHLKKYTAPERNKTYYQNHKEEVIKKVTEHRNKTGYKYVPSAEKKKEYSRRAYLIPILGVLVKNLV